MVVPETFEAMTNLFKKFAKETTGFERVAAKAELETGEEHPMMARAKALAIEQGIDFADACLVVAGKEPALYADYTKTLGRGAKTAAASSKKSQATPAASHPFMLAANAKAETDGCDFADAATAIARTQPALYADYNHTLGRR